MKWVMLTKRTNDPKLKWLEARLQGMGIPTRRNGSSFHAPIMEVPEEHKQRAWDFLSYPFDGGGETVDDMADDDPTFNDEF